MFLIIKSFLINTPIWVFPLFAYLLFIGIRATRERTIFIPKMFLIPIIFLAMKYKNIYHHPFLFLSILLVSASISFLLQKKPIYRKTDQKLHIQTPGSYSSLVSIFLFFPSKYFFGYIKYSNPLLYTSLSPIDLGISLILSGYLIGKSLGYLYSYQKELQNNFFNKTKNQSAQ